MIRDERRVCVSLSVRASHRRATSVSADPFCINPPRKHAEPAQMPLKQPNNPHLHLQLKLGHSCTRLCVCPCASATLLLISPTPDGEERSSRLDFLPDLIGIDPKTTLLVCQAKKAKQKPPKPVTTDLHLSNACTRGTHSPPTPLDVVDTDQRREPGGKVN